MGRLSTTECTYLPTYLPKRMCECAISKVLRASRRNGVLIIPRSARLLNPADVLPVPRGTPRVSPPLTAQFLCWRKTLGEYPAHESKVAKTLT